MAFGIIEKLAAALVIVSFPFLLFGWGLAVLVYGALVWASQTIKASPDA